MLRNLGLSVPIDGQLRGLNLDKRLRRVHVGNPLVRVGPLDCFLNAGFLGRTALIICDITTVLEIHDVKHRASLRGHDSLGLNSRLILKDRRMAFERVAIALHSVFS
jgi:hypothetical protein